MIRGVISTPYTQSSEQLTDVITKGLSAGVFGSLYAKLGMIDVYTLARGGVLKS